MHSTFLRAAPLLLALLPTPAFGQEEAGSDVVHWSDLFGTDVRFSLYGFLRGDIQYSDSRFNDVQIPGYVQSEDPTAAPAVGAENDDSEFSLHARLTRFGINLVAPELDALHGGELTGTVEIDFYNIGLPDSDSRNAVRMRKAYVQAAWEHWSFLVGQTWDLISPLYPAVNHDLVMWGAGNTGDRRPQARAQYSTAAGTGRFTAGFGIALSGAVAGATAEGGLRSGENSGEPMLNARLGYEGKTSSGGAYQVGVWGHTASEDYDATGAGSDQSYDSSSVGVDVRVPVHSDRLWLSGEYWTGENVDDIRGGIFQGVNATTGQEIESEGGWIELGAKATDHLSVHAGFSMDDPEDGDLSASQRSKNEVAYIAARWRYDVLGFGLEYLNWETEYIGLDSGDANRFQAYMAFYF